jgi:hypothetical protein
MEPRHGPRAGIGAPLHALYRPCERCQLPIFECRIRTAFPKKNRHGAGWRDTLEGASQTKTLVWGTVSDRIEGDCCRTVAKPRQRKRRSRLLQPPVRSLGVKDRRIRVGGFFSQNYLRSLLRPTTAPNRSPNANEPRSRRVAPKRMKRVA